ncbi:MAG: hypothetical protein AAFX87_18715 [Bacteroidota bacterium]
MENQKLTSEEKEFERPGNDIPASKEPNPETERPIGRVPKVEEPEVSIERPGDDIPATKEPDSETEKPGGIIPSK